MSTTLSGSVTSVRGENTGSISVTVTGGLTGSVYPIIALTGSIDPNYPYTGSL
jgi:hypothetical protein